MQRHIVSESSACQHERCLWSMGPELGGWAVPYSPMALMSRSLLIGKIDSSFVALVAQRAH